VEAVVPAPFAIVAVLVVAIGLSLGVAVAALTVKPRATAPLSRAVAETTCATPAPASPCGPAPSREG
jgi:hypothetical protein